MNPTQLMAHFEKVSDTPDAIPRLRRFILNLAVRGKLVPQESDDEPASELLTQIAKKRAQLAKAGKIRIPKPSPAIRCDELPFALPKNVRWDDAINEPLGFLGWRYRLVISQGYQV
jgi:type I restriction enzyme, S subunit